MKKKNQRDALRLLETFQKEVLSRKPESKEMITELRMMRFKIKPVQGDVTHIDFNNREFIEILWSLGKLDEFFHKQYAQLKGMEREQFILYFKLMQNKFQDELNKLRLHQTPPKNEAATGFEIEISKDRLKKKRTN